MDPTTAFQPVDSAVTRIGGIELQAEALQRRAAAQKGDGELRERVGEFVANIFYATLMRQMEQSSLKTEYYHGGRGEDVFRGQLNLELAKRIGRSVNDPVGNRLYEAIRRHTSRATQPARGDA